MLIILNTAIATSARRIDASYKAKPDGNGWCRCKCKRRLMSIKIPAPQHAILTSSQLVATGRSAKCPATSSEAGLDRSRSLNRRPKGAGVAEARTSSCMHASPKLELGPAVPCTLCLTKGRFSLSETSTFLFWRARHTTSQCARSARGVAKVGLTPSPEIGCTSLPNRRLVFLHACSKGSPPSSFVAALRFTDPRSFGVRLDLAWAWRRILFERHGSR